MIRKGRYLNIQREERLYKACNILKDKIHFLDKCIKCNQIRLQLLITFRVELASNVTQPSPSFLINNMQNV